MSQDQETDITIKPTRFDLVLEAATVLVFAASWVFLLFRHICPWAYSDVFEPPDVFNLLLLAVVNWSVFRSFIKTCSPLGLCKSVKITKENAERQYRLSTRSDRWTNLAVACFFSFMIIDMNLIRTDMTETWCKIAICGTFIVMVAIGLYYYIRARMLK